MPILIEEILKGVADGETLSTEMHGVCALAILLEDYKEYRNKYDATIPEMTEESSGREFKDALHHLPPKVRIELLSKYIKNLEGEKESIAVTTDNVVVESVGGIGESDFQQSKTFLIKLITYGFMVAGLLILFLIFYSSIYGLDHGGDQTFSAILNGLIEILKVIVGI